MTNLTSSSGSSSGSSSDNSSEASYESTQHTSTTSVVYEIPVRETVPPPPKPKKKTDKSVLWYIPMIGLFLVYIFMVISPPILLRDNLPIYIIYSVLEVVKYIIMVWWCCILGYYYDDQGFLIYDYRQYYHKIGMKYLCFLYLHLFISSGLVVYNYIVAEANQKWEILNTISLIFVFIVTSIHTIYAFIIKDTKQDTTQV
uniref:Uncharacterized protein n=1 Tax=viral metagenome TaxID=1070528 RepID=A0A6C0CKQ0_9ZZZZ